MTEEQQGEHLPSQHKEISESSDAPRFPAQMASGLSAVQSVLGPSTPISDRDIKDALWDSYFDVDGTVAYLLGKLNSRSDGARFITFPQA